jgi:hypothetical protein
MSRGFPIAAIHLMKPKSMKKRVSHHFQCFRWQVEFPPIEFGSNINSEAAPAVLAALLDLASSLEAAPSHRLTDTKGNRLRWPRQKVAQSDWGGNEWTQAQGFQPWNIGKLKLNPSVDSWHSQNLKIGRYWKSDHFRTISGSDWRWWNH